MRTPDEMRERRERARRSRRRKQSATTFGAVIIAGLFVAIWALAMVALVLGLIRLIGWLA